MLYNGTGKSECRKRVKKLLTDLGIGNQSSHNPNNMLSDEYFDLKKAEKIHCYG